MGLYGCLVGFCKDFCISGSAETIISYFFTVCVSWVYMAVKSGFLRFFGVVSGVAEVLGFFTQRAVKSGFLRGFLRVIYFRFS